MAKIKPVELIRSMSGRVCGHSATYFTTRHGETYTATVCKKRSTPFNEKEISQHVRFKAANTAAIERMRGEHAEDMEAFKRQKKYKTLRGWLIARAYACCTDEGVVDWNA